MTHEIVLVVIAVFLASVVEAVEALTIVLAVALTTGWRTALLGAGLAVLALVLVVFALGPVLVRVSPGYSGSARRPAGVRQCRLSTTRRRSSRKRSPPAACLRSSSNSSRFR